MVFSVRLMLSLHPIDSIPLQTEHQHFEGRKVSRFGSSPVHLEPSINLLFSSLHRELICLHCFRWAFPPESAAMACYCILLRSICCKVKWYVC